MKKVIYVLLFTLPIFSLAQPLPIPSAVYEWKMLPVVADGAKETRHIIDGPTETLNNFRINHYQLSEGNSITIKKGDEKLILIGSGELLINQGDEVDDWVVGVSPGLQRRRLLKSNTQELWQPLFL